MEHFKLKLSHTSIEHRRPSINVRSLLLSTNCVIKETISQSANSESFRAKMRDTLICFPILTLLYLVSNCLYFHVKWRKGRHFWCEDCRFVCFETVLGKTMLTLNDPNGFKYTTDVYSIHLNCEWHSSAKSAPENENMSTHMWIFSVYPINVRRT